jgi:hypothetical protein
MCLSELRDRFAEKGSFQYRYTQWTDRRAVLWAIVSSCSSYGSYSIASCSLFLRCIYTQISVGVHLGGSKCISSSNLMLVFGSWVSLGSKLTKEPKTSTIESVSTELRLRKWARSLGIDIYGRTCVCLNCETDSLKRVVPIPLYSVNRSKGILFVVLWAIVSSCSSCTDLILSLHAAFPKAHLYPSLRGSPPRRV